MRMFALKSCDTCRRALRELNAAGMTPEVVDVRADGLIPADIELIVKAFGDRAVNRASTTWRGLSDNEKERDINELLADHPTLMKRPVIMHGERRTIGWTDDARSQWLGNST